MALKSARARLDRIAERVRPKTRPDGLIRVPEDLRWGSATATRWIRAQKGKRVADGYPGKFWIVLPAPERDVTAWSTRAVERGREASRAAQAAADAFWEAEHQKAADALEKSGNAVSLEPRSDVAVIDTPEGLVAVPRAEAEERQRGGVQIVKLTRR